MNDTPTPTPVQPPSMFLTKEELEAMTEATKRPLQIEWLDKNRIAYTRGRRGGINVLRKLVEKAHGIKDDIKPEAEIDMDSFKRMHPR